MPNKVSLYASVGPELTHYDVDVDARDADASRHRQACRRTCSMSGRTHRGGSCTSRPATARRAWGRPATRIT